MIKKVTIEHFFSFGTKTEITLNEEINILIGINGSGKSNFIKALRLLHEGMVGGGFEKLFAQKWGGFSGAGNFGKNDADKIALTYEFDAAILSETLLSIPEIYQKSPLCFELIIGKNGRNGDGYTLSEWLYMENGERRITFFKTENGHNALIDPSEVFEETIELPSSNHATRNPRELMLRMFPSVLGGYFFLAISQIAIYDAFDTTFESPIRQLSPYYSDKRLLSNGQNLSFLLNYLNGNATSSYDLILEQLKNVNPHFREMVFTTPTAGKTLLSLKEKNLERAITIEHISDGTLRFLLLMSIFYNPERGKIICLDEPEIGLHPDMINAVCKGIQYAAQHGTQVIVATHSPLLMNGFVLEDLLVFEKDQQNNTIVAAKSEDEFEGWEGDFLVGQMWLRGQIGGTRW